MEEQYYRAWLLAQEGVGAKAVERALLFFGSLTAAAGLSYQDWQESNALTAAQLAVIPQLFTAGKVAAYRERCLQAGVQLLIPEDESYPQLLREIPDPPALLYAQGNLALLNKPGVAMVGTRRSTPYGRRVAEMLAGDLASCGMTIVSGLARGIDTAALRSALAASGDACAVVGTGLDLHYPTENRVLQEQIAATGLLLSEYALGVPALSRNFPRRNRIISGLSLGVVVVEAARQSGTSFTVSYALEQGREVFAAPGSLFSEYSQGTHALIKQGAHLVESAEDILEELGLLQAAQGNAFSEAVNYTLIQQRILDSLYSEGVHVDKLQEETRLPIGTLLGELLQLELQGAIASLPGRYYLKLV